MFENTNAMNPYGVPQQPMYGGQPFTQYNQQAAPKMTQVLNQEQINKLRNNGGTFDLRLTEEDILRSVCTHKDKGAFVLVENPDGSVTCPICGETFSLSTNPKFEDVELATNVILDFLQSTKTLYLNIPEETVSNYFQMIPLLKKLPQLHKMALDDFNKYYANVSYMNQYTNTSGFNLYNNILSPNGMSGFYGQPQPMQGGNMMYPQQPQGNMMYPQQQPMMAPVYPQQMGGAPMMGANPFAYGAVQTPMMQPMVPQPMMGQQPVAPVAPAAPSTVEQTKVMNV